MKNKILYLFAVVFTIVTMASCGVGGYSVSSGYDDVAGVCFVSPTKMDVVVQIDEEIYKNVEVVRKKAYKQGMHVKQTANNTISIPTGSHRVVVKDVNGRKLYDKVILVSSGQTKIIKL